MPSRPLMPLWLLIVLIITAGAQVVAQHPANREYFALAPRAGAQPLTPLFQQPLTDVSISVGPDGAYYLTGSSVDQGGAIFSPTITLWRSADKKEWSQLREIKLDGTKARSPEVHYLRDALWLTYGREGGGTDLVRFDTLDLAAGPFRTAHITAEGEDPSLFLDDDGKLYWVMGSGQVARLKPDPLAGLEEKPVQIEITPQATVLQKDPSKTVGTRGAFLTKIRGRYYLFAADRTVRRGLGRIATPGGADDTYAASSDNLYRGYGHRYIAFPHAGQTTLFHAAGELWATFSGNDANAVFQLLPGVFPVEIAEVPPTEMFPGVLIRPCRSFIFEAGPVGSLRPAKVLANAQLPHPWLRDISVCTASDGHYYMTGTTGENVEKNGIGGEDYIGLWRSTDLLTWEPVKRVWEFGNDAGKWYNSSQMRSRQLWAPEIHYINGTYWLVFCSTAKPAGSGLLKSSNGRPEGPYVPAFSDNAPLVKGIDPTLFQDTDGTVYYAWMNGHIRQLNQKMNGFVTEDRVLKTVDGESVGYEGITMAKIGPWYVIGAADWNGDVRYQGSYDLMYAVSKNIWGPYSKRRLAVPHAGHSSLFQDRAGRWYATMFGNDRTAPFRTAAGMVPLEVVDTGDDLILKPTRLQAAPERVDLSGTWRFAFDQNSVGESQRWFARSLADSISLPGTTETNRKSDLQKNNSAERWKSPYEFRGKAWYQREITIPLGWEGKHMRLFLERARPSRAWVDGNEMGDRILQLPVPHVYDLAGIKPGKHQLTVLVDSACRVPIGYGHEAALQGPWNGIIGRIELQASDPVWIDHVRITPDLNASSTRLAIRIGNVLGIPAKGSLRIVARATSGGQSYQTESLIVPFEVDAKVGTIATVLPMGENAPRWDEFTPTLFTLDVTLAAQGRDNRAVADQRSVEFGFREFTHKGSQLLINGRPVFLRGTHDGCTFPLTGHPPMDVAGWTRYFQICKEYGLNHVRFHSWCPPEAAFQAAARTGVYLQPEVHRFGGTYDKPDEYAYGLETAKQILDAYANYPSFCLFTFGNEGGGNTENNTRLLQAVRAYDNRVLMANRTNLQGAKPTPGDDFLVSFDSGGGPESAMRASNSYGTDRLHYVEDGPPGTTFDYRRAYETDKIKDNPIPLISHETGQYQVYPNYDEMKKYTGVKQVPNFEIFRERLKEAGMFDQWPDFFKASARLAAICYRADVEASLRTPGFGGFQLLDLKDYPGQGTALVGMLDVFLDSKGAIAPQRWREFCSETVPLFLMEKYVWTTDELLRGRLEVAHYGPVDMRATIRYSLLNAAGQTVASGSFGRVDLKPGKLTTVGELSLPLHKVTAPSRYDLLFEVEGTAYRNRYPVWVYSPGVSTETPNNVVVARAWDDSVCAKVNQGVTVLLFPRPETLPNAVDGMFSSDFWNFGMFRRASINGGKPVSPGTLGLLCNPAHPALKGFPTEFHSDWQWWHVLKGAQVMVLDSTPKTFRPILQMIDNVERNHKLGMLFEARVGQGRLLVCSIPLPDMPDRPEARQLYRSLLDYAASSAAAPVAELSAATLTALLSPVHNIARGANAKASSALPGHPAALVVDGRLNTCWISSGKGNRDDMEIVVEDRLVTKKGKDRGLSQWLELDLGRPRDFTHVVFHWRAPFWYQYLIQGSTTGKNWTTLADQRRNRKGEDVSHLEVKAGQIRFIRVVLTGAQVGPPALCEIEIRDR